MPAISRKREPYRRVKAYLVEMNIKQKDLAPVLRLAPNTIAKKLNGLGGDFTLHEVQRLNRSFGIPIAYFFDLDVPIKEHEAGDRR